MKKILFIVLSFTLLFTGMISVKAAQANITVSASQGQVIVGNEVTVSVTISSASQLGSWEYILNYDKSLFKLVENKSDSLRIADVFRTSTPPKSISYKYVFKAIKNGTGSFYTSSSNVIGFDDSIMGVVDGKRNVAAITYAEYEASLSKNNNLASLTIEGAEITPEFNKDTLEYSTKVSEDTKEIMVKATPEDNTANVTGDGTLTVSAGTNSFKIVVIAENGAEKTYTLNVEVIDKDPINVTVNNKKYTVVKIRENLEAPHSFKETTIKIENFDIPAYYSDIMKFTVVGLKDEKGNIELFIYDNGKYTLYTELNFGNITIYPLDMQSELKGYSKAKLKVQNTEVECLEKSSDSRYKLIYGKNVETNEEGLFLLDNKDKTIIKFDEETNNLTEKRMKMLLFSTLAFVVSTVLALIALLASSRKKKGNKKKTKDIIDNAKEEKNENKIIEKDLDKTKKISKEELTKTKAIKKEDLSKTKKIDINVKENVPKEEVKESINKTTKLNKIDKTTKIEKVKEEIQDDEDEVYDIFSDDRKKKKKKKNK